MAAKRFCKFLAEEIIAHILVKIQCTKTILRCTCVCKSWYSLIKSSEFINTHLSRPNSTKLLLCKTKTSPMTKASEVSDYYCLCSDCELSKKRCTLVLPDKLKHIEMHGCCNGVICYTKPRNRGIIYLWNPTVRKLKTLPQFGKNSRLHIAIGFWFNTEKNDYEVAKIIYDSVRTSVYVYSLRCNSWKIISDACPGTLKIFDSSLVHARGALHWLGVQTNGWTFATLNINNAKFQEESFNRWVSPADFYLIGASIFYLNGVDANSLVIIGNGRERIQSNNRVWQNCSFILYVHEESTTFFSHLKPAGFSKNGNALFWKLEEKKMVSYDFETAQFKDLVFDADNVITGYPFVKSLVLLNDGDVLTTSASYRKRSRI